jgi:hypothetical protein
MHDFVELLQAGNPCSPYIIYGGESLFENFPLCDDTDRLFLLEYLQDSNSNLEKFSFLV